MRSIAPSRLSTQRLKIWCLTALIFCGFGLWSLGAILTVQLPQLGYAFSEAECQYLLALAALSGVSLRIPHSFLASCLAPGQTFFYSLLGLLVVSIGLALALAIPTTPLWCFQALALGSGLGGGVFASGMGQVFKLAAREHQGLELGIAGGLGNLAVAVTQISLYLILTGAQSSWRWQAFSQNLAVYSCLFVLSTALLWWRIQPFSINLSFSGFKLFALSHGFAWCLSVLAAFLLQHSGLMFWWDFVLLIGAQIVLLPYLSGRYKPQLKQAYALIQYRPAWLMAFLYFLSFGIFLGLAQSTLMLIDSIFGAQHLWLNGTWKQLPNPNAPEASMFIWLGVFLASLLRPFGGALADFVSAKSLLKGFFSGMFLLLSALASLSYTASHSPEPESFFLLFFIALLLFFCLAGLGNGVIFQWIATAHEAHAESLLGWTSALGAYAAYMFLQLFSGQFEVQHIGLYLGLLSLLYVPGLLLLHTTGPKQAQSFHLNNINNSNFIQQKDLHSG